MTKTRILPGGVSPPLGEYDEVVRDLTQKHHDLTEAMQRLIRFQRQALVLKNSPSIDNALDSMESLLIEIIDFAYASLQYRDESGAFSALRQICPENIGLDYALMEWVMGTQEVSVLPIDVAMEEGRLRALLFLPFGTHHIMLLWLDQDTDAFTQEEEALLSVLSREMASVLDAHHYRMRLEKARATMSDLIESVPLGLIALDHNGRVQMINSTAEIALGVRRREAVGVDHHSALPRQLVELISGAEGKNDAEEAELPIVKAGNDTQFLGVTISRIRSEDGSGKSGLAVVCRDLQLSREVQKLRELDTMKNDFLSLVTHELRTPLTSIIAYSETLMMDASDNVPGEWREYIEIIHNEGKRLAKLIEDVLDLTRMEAGKMTYSFEQQDPNEIIGSVIMSITPLIDAKRHSLELDLGEDIGDCRLDPNRFTQVVNNILSNAIKYTNSSGKIRIVTRREEPQPGSAIPAFHMIVEDNGIGIAAENMDKVFSKFEMVEAVKNHTVGTGLGMAICKQIVEEGHGGAIWLESEVGKGTKVHVQIPLK